MNCSAFGSVSLMSSQHISSPLQIHWIPDSFAPSRAPDDCVFPRQPFNIFMNVYIQLNNSDSFLNSNPNFFNFCNKFVSCVPFSAKCERMLCVDHAFASGRKSRETFAGSFEKGWKLICETGKNFARRLNGSFVWGKNFGDNSIWRGILNVAVAAIAWRARGCFARANVATTHPQPRLKPVTTLFDWNSWNFGQGLT